MNKSENKNVIIKEFFIAPKPKQTSSTAFKVIADCEGARYPSK